MHASFVTQQAERGGAAGEAIGGGHDVDAAGSDGARLRGRRQDAESDEGRRRVTGRPQRY